MTDLTQHTDELADVLYETTMHYLYEQWLNFSTLPDNQKQWWREKAEDALGPVVARIVEGAKAEALREVAAGIESQSPEMSFRDASLYFRFADWLRNRAATFGGAR